MSYDLVITPAANDDIIAAMHWYDEQDENLGERFIAALQSRLADIQQSPLFPRLIGGLPIRRILLIRWPYFIYYRVIDQIIRIIAVIHTSRDPKYTTQRISS